MVTPSPDDTSGFKVDTNFLLIVIIVLLAVLFLAPKLSEYREERALCDRMFSPETPLEVCRILRGVGDD